MSIRLAIENSELLDCGTCLSETCRLNLPSGAQYAATVRQKALHKAYKPTRPPAGQVCSLLISQQPILNKQCLGWQRRQSHGLRQARSAAAFRALANLVLPAYAAAVAWAFCPFRRQGIHPHHSIALPLTVRKVSRQLLA